MKSTKTQLLAGLFIASILLSVPSLMRIPRLLPFLNAEVRNAAPKALAQLQGQGLWLVNVDFRSADIREGEVCFQWEHRYRSRTRVFEPELITTCIDT